LKNSRIIFRGYSYRNAESALLGWAQSEAVAQSADGVGRVLDGIVAL